MRRSRRSSSGSPFPSRACSAVRSCPGSSGMPLARVLLGLLALLTAYATLYPMEGWRDPGLSPFAYLSAPWPRHITRFDLAVNVLGYLPFGALAVAALHPRLRGVPAFVAGTAAALALS